MNDLGVEVRLRLCDDNDCGSFHPPNETLAPGEDWDWVNVSSSGVPNVYLVESPDETLRYGCLPLVTPSLRSKITVRTSEHVPCRSHIDEDQFWPKRWEKHS